MKLEQIAMLAGVSRTTASYVINGKANNIESVMILLERSWQ